MTLLLTLLSKIVVGLLSKAMLAWYFVRRGRRQAHEEIKRENLERRVEAQEWEHRREDGRDLRDDFPIRDRMRDRAAKREWSAREDSGETDSRNAP
jgi:hypothetical protein